jgi:hypothetical protein
MNPTIQMRIDVGGVDFVPHTFISITNPDGRIIEYGLAPAEHLSVAGPGKIDITGIDSQLGREHEWTFAGAVVELTNDQYNTLMNSINNAIANPPDYSLAGSWWIGTGNNCTGWAVNIWQEVGLFNQSGITNSWVWNPYGQGLAATVRLFLNHGQIVADELSRIPDIIAERYGQAQNAIQPIRRDPLVLDIDNDGLETTGIISTTNPILFNHNADGIKTATGWVNADDAFLVLDKNANGLIDDGRELFGDATIKSNGQLAQDGFDALCDLDSNADGKIDASDAQFTNLRLWRDLNQDGISQSNELLTLNSQNIAAINVASHFQNPTYGARRLTPIAPYGLRPIAFTALVLLNQKVAANDEEWRRAA